MILTFATLDYKDWLAMLTKSFRKSNPDRKLKAYLMGWPEEELRQYKNSQYVEFAPIPGDFFNGKNKFEPLMRLKMSLILFEILLTKQSVIWVDADSLILKDLDPLYEKLNTYDVIVTSRPGKLEYQKIAAGVVGFSARQRTIDILARAALEGWLYQSGWYADQHCLYSALFSEAQTDELKKVTEKLHKDVLVGKIGDFHYPLTDDEHSLHGNKNAIILSHHGNGREDMVKIYDDMMRV